MNLEAILFVLITASVCLIVWKFDPTRGKVFSYVSLPSHIILLFSMVYHDQISASVAGANFSISRKTYISIFFIELGYILGVISYYILPTKLKIKKQETEANYSVAYPPLLITSGIYICFTFSLIALFINLNRVGFNVTILFSNARSYESVFGKSWIVNYIYFLHLPTLFLLIIKYIQEKRLSFRFYLIGIFSVLMSFFHGIKFTIFDAIFFPFFFYLSLNGLSRNAKKFGLLLISLFILIFSLFSYTIRGGRDNFNLFSFIDYITPNYMNLFYLIEKNEFFFAWPFEGFVGILSQLLPLPRELPLVEFHLNDSYNMITGFPFLLGYFSYAGIFVYYLICILIIKKAEILNNFVMHTLSAYVMFSMFMFFYAYYLGTKPKYVFLVLVSILIHSLLTLRKN